MVRFHRAIVWYFVYTVVAALCCAAAITVTGMPSPYAIVAGVFLAFVSAVAIAACSPVLVPAVLLAIGTGPAFSPVMAILGGLFALIALQVAPHIAGGVEQALVREIFVHAAIVGAISGWIADRLCRSWIKSPAPPAATGDGFFGILTASGEPTAGARVLVVLAVAGLAAYAWAGTIRNPVYKVTFDVAYGGAVLHLAASYQCKEGFGSPKRNDLFRGSMWFRLPDGKAMIIEPSDLCLLSEAQKKRWAKTVRISLFNDASNPTELRVYEDAALERQDRSAPRLIDATIAETDEEMPARQPTPSLAFSEIGVAGNVNITNKIDFVGLKAVRYPKDRWADNPDVRFVKDPARPYMTNFASNLMVRLEDGALVGALKWTYYDFESRRFASAPDAAPPGFVKASRTALPTSGCEVRELMKIVSKEGQEASEQRDQCYGPFAFYDPADQSISVIFPQFYAYLPAPKPEQ